MKGTGVVQGLKSLAAKIHPQLPLDVKESNRLLTALTSSFRKHLDEAHPTAAKQRVEHDKDVTSKHGGVAERQSHGIHSSAVYADRHLASVLTNPLLAKGTQRLDYAAAKRELIENPAKDPIQVLEEYHEKNAATVRIAELCLENFKTNLTNMSEEARKTYILRSEPGRRAFLCLLQDKLYDPAAYVDNLRFQDLMAYFLVHEGREYNVWEWIRLDLTIADDQQDKMRRNKKKQAGGGYRWRGRLLRSLIRVKLGLFDRPSEPVSDDRLHEALDAFFYACEMKLSGQQRQDHLSCVPLAGAGVLLHRQLQVAPWHEPRVTMDVQRFDRFYETVPLYMEGYMEGAAKFYLDAAYANLDLCHPRHASADRTLQLWQDVLSADPYPSAAAFLTHLRNGMGSTATHRWFCVLERTIFMLQNDGRSREASWLIDNAIPYFPKQSPYLEETLRRHRARSHPEENEATATNRSVENHHQMPIPTFA